MEKARKLINDIRVKKQKWNERSQFTLKGVRNLSMSDLDTLTLYAEHIILYGHWQGLLRPRGSIAEVLTKYGIEGRG